MTSQWNNKVVVVAGGSDGLGLEIARAFANLGSRCIIIARDNDRLAKAVKQIKESSSNEVSSISVDVTEPERVKQSIEEISHEFSQIDVWVNAFGRSIRKSVADCQTSDYRELMELNFFAAVECSMAALPWLEKSNGHLVNIGSLASKTAWPFVGPYSASKHALASFSQQLRIEGDSNVHVLHVCSGPIARQNSEDRYSDQTTNLTGAAHKPGAGAPVKLIDPADLAKQIVRACEQRKPEIVTSFKSRMLFGIAQLWPSMGDRLIRRFSRK